MCGIAGVFAEHGALDHRHHETLHHLNQWQAHRGPDGEGFWASGDRTVMFAHRRLAIIDTGPSGAQPMTDSTGRWTINLNGEIYNYRFLRTKLERLGRQFSTNSDTEVLMNSIAEWGEGGLTQLRGMFAFALWDNQEKELWFARDPYGIKPLYLAEIDGATWFASQARALAECVPIPDKRDAAGLVGFYLWGSVPEPFSWWADIRPVGSGCVERFTLGTRKRKARQYYSIPSQFAAEKKGRLAKSDLRHVLMDSVEHHLVSDTDVGVFLSAGVDSNVIASLASTKLAKLKTITLAFQEYENTPNDEAPLAELAARTLGSDHKTVRIGKGEFDALLSDFFRKMDQPTIDGLNTYLISRAAASQGLKVVLSGLGGDELFGSYPSFKQIPLLLKLGAAPGIASFGRLTQRMSRELFPELFASKLMSIFAYSGNVLDAYMLRRCVFLKEGLDLLLDESWIEQGLSRLAEARAQQLTISPVAGARTRAQISALESCSYLRNQLLRDADWAGMAHGIEIRVPFVDRAVLESLGPCVASKYPPRKSDLAVAAGIPAELRRRRKTGFITPAHQWVTTEKDASRRSLAHWTSMVPRIFHSEMPALQFSGTAQTAA